MHRKSRILVAVIALVLFGAFALFVPIRKTATPADSWNGADFDRKYAPLKELTGMYEKLHRSKGVMPGKQIVMKRHESHMYESLFGMTRIGQVHSSTVIVGYVLADDLPQIFTEPKGNVVTPSTYDQVSTWLEERLSPNL